MCGMSEGAFFIILGCCMFISYIAGWYMGAVKTYIKMREILNEELRKIKVKDLGGR
jgi:hypothetical protein